MRLDMAQKPIHTLRGHSHVVTSVAVDAAGGMCSGSYDGKVYRWDVSSGEKIGEFNPPKGTPVVTAIVCVGPFMLRADRDKKVRKYLLRTGQCIWVIDKAHTCSVSCMDATDDILATGSVDGVARIFDIGDGSMLRKISIGGPVARVCLGDGGSTLFTGADDGSIRKWGLEECDCQMEFYGHSKAITALATNGEYLWSGSKDTIARQWDLADANCVRLISGHHGPVTGLAIQGDRLFVAADVLVREKSISTGRAGAVLHGHTSNITGMTITDEAEGTHVFTSSEDCTVCHWVVRPVVNESVFSSANRSKLSASREEDQQIESSALSQAAPVYTPAAQATEEQLSDQLCDRSAVPEVVIEQLSEAATEPSAEAAVEPWAKQPQQTSEPGPHPAGFERPLDEEAAAMR